MKKKISFIMTLVLMLSMVQIPLLAHAQGMLNNQIKHEECKMVQLNYANNWPGKRQDSNDKNGSKDIVEIATSDGRFNTLVSALKAAGLDETLKGNGPFTVFAPTDEAFAKLPTATFDMLLKPENKDALIKILTYHVAPGKLLAADVSKLNGKEITMASGDKVKVEVKDNSVYINGAKITVTDIVAKNGVIHVIDAVLMPQ